MAISRVARRTPEVVVVEPGIRSIPGIAPVVALDEAIPRMEEAITRRRIQPVGREPVHDQGMGIERPAGLAILPCLAPIQAPHECACLSRSEEAAGHQGIARTPADMRGPGA